MELSGKTDNNGLSESDGALRQAAAQPDRAMHLARLLERRGVRLSVDWRDALPFLPVRVFHVLSEAGYETLAEVLQALRNDGAGLIGKKNFGRKSLNDLWGALEEAAGPGATLYQSSLFESSESLSADQLEIEGVPLPLSEQMLARLEAAGVDPDQPWQNELPMLSTRLRNVISEMFVSLREVVIAATDRIDELRRTKNLGRNSLNELGESLEMLARNGPGYMRYGELGAPTASIDDLIARALQYLPDKEGRLLIRRFLDGATLEQLGCEYDLTRERIRQKINKILINLHRRLGEDARGLVKSLIDATESSGGLLHRDAAVNLAATQTIRHAWLALLIAGEDSFRIWRGEFLTTLEREELERRLGAIRNCFRDNRKNDLFLPDVAGLVAASSGFKLDPAGLACLLTKHLDCRIADDGSVRLRGVRIPDQLEKILRTAGRPMRISEIAGIYLAGSASSGIETFADLESNEDDESEVGPDEERKQELVERALAGAILRHEDIYLYGPKTFVHVDALPVPLEKLDEIVDLCVSRIDGETGAVTTDYLLRILDGAGLGHDGVNKFLLKDALSRRPEIIGLRKLRVGHAASFQEHGLKLVDRIEAILRASERPLSSIEIIHRLPRNNEYFPVSISLSLRKAPFAVNLGERYVHIESLGLSGEQRERLVETASRLLPEDGTPVSCAAILNSLRPCLPDLGLAGRDDAIDILRGLLRLLANVQCGAGYLVARRIEGRGQPLLKELILQIIRDAVVIYPRDIMRELANRYGEQQSQNTVTAHLHDAIRNGQARRLPVSLYFLPDVDEMALLNALTAHDQAMRNMMEASDFAERSADDLWLLARYSYQQNDHAGADRLLSFLQTRGDLTDERRRNCNRLRSVILNGI
ncbi:MAG: DNA-directed RNA polymerase subunit alpha C-terminal domain-containing protein [Blastocatellia bacterium]